MYSPPRVTAAATKLLPELRVIPGFALDLTTSDVDGRAWDFDHKDMLVSRMTRQSIDMLKENFRDELTKDDWRLVVELKKNLEMHTGDVI